jgi:hypothetical protein
MLYFAADAPAGMVLGTRKTPWQLEHSQRLYTLRVLQQALGAATVVQDNPLQEPLQVVLLLLLLLSRLLCLLLLVYCVELTGPCGLWLHLRCHVG